MSTDTSSTDQPIPAACPFHGPSERLVTSAEPRPERAVTLDARGNYQVHSYEAGRQLLRAEETRQAGFMAERAGDTPGLGRAPVLFAEGELHHEMRRSTARYFTPAAVGQYQAMLERLADGLIARLAAQGQADLDELSVHMAVDVAARVLGLTDSLLPGLERRVMRFVEGGLDSDPDAAQPPARLRGLLSQAQVLSFFLLDVQPAIRARRRDIEQDRPRDDLITHLIGRGSSDAEILTECLTFGTAGMVTTREFISAAAWQLLSRPALRNEYLYAPEAERHALLHEILRLEPVVARLYRRATADLTLDGVTIPAGSVIGLDLTQTNTDPALLGDTAEGLCPGRALPRGVPPQLLAFGDGHHRCPGAFLAIRESDVFLRRLLMLDVRVVTPPSVRRNETVKGYELRGFRLALG